MRWLSARGSSRDNRQHSICTHSSTLLLGQIIQWEMILYRRIDNKTDGKWWNRVRVGPRWSDGLDLDWHALSRERLPPERRDVVENVPQTFERKLSLEELVQDGAESLA